MMDPIDRSQRDRTVALITNLHEKSPQLLREFGIADIANEIPGRADIGDATGLGALQAAILGE
jgi:hypothetical protein